MEEHQPIHMEATENQIWDIVLRQFDIPALRRDVSKKANVNWLLRNVRVRNSDNPNIDLLLAALKNHLKTLKTLKSS